MIKPCIDFYQDLEIKILCSTLLLPENNYKSLKMRNMKLRITKAVLAETCGQKYAGSGWKNWRKAYGCR